MVRGDTAFKALVIAFSLGFIFFFFFFILELFFSSGPVWRNMGLNFLLGLEWNPLKDKFGLLPFLYGTFISSTIALLLAGILGLGTAIFLAEIASGRLREMLSSLVELIAAIPSVVIGLWGVFVLAPFVRDILQPSLQPFSFIPIFSGKSLSGLSMFTAILVLTFMVTPIVSTVVKDALLAVPEDLKEAMYSLGATRYEVVRHVEIPYTKDVIIGGLILGYGRAIGETMAVTMVIGNVPSISISLWSPASTMASIIANELAEASGALHFSSLIAIAFSLMMVSLTINFLGRWVMKRWTRGELRI